MGLLVFDLSHNKYIGVFFLMCFLANYLNFFGMTYILRNIGSSEVKLLRKKTNLYWSIMNALYALVVIMAVVWVDWIGPRCHKHKLYPPCLNFSSALFIFNAIYHVIIHKKGYWLTWEGAGDTLLPAADGQKVKKLTQNLSFQKEMFTE